MMNRLVRKCSSVTAGELWVPDMTNSMMESHAITNETAIAQMSLRRVRSPLSGSFSIDYLCKYIATTSPKADMTSTYPDTGELLDSHSINEELEEMSNSSLSTTPDGLSSGVHGLPELEAQEMDSGYVSFPPVDDISTFAVMCSECLKQQIGSCKD